MPYTKPITTRIIYRHLNQFKVLDIFEENLPKLNISYREIYFQDDFNITLFQNGKFVFFKSSNNNKKQDSFTNVTCNISSILGHVLASFPDRASQSGIANLGISDRQLIYCTRKTAKNKSYCHKQVNFRFLKNYSTLVYGEALRK